MKRIFLKLAAPAFLWTLFCSSSAWGQDSFAAFRAPRPSLEQLSRDTSGYRAWKFSLAPLLASQALDSASSYGLRELNPALAGSDGRFGMKAAGLKFGVAGAIVGLEYLIVKKHPRAARVISKLNWSGAVVTTGFAAHNFAIR